ncbi:hypothetical protein [Rhodophyticola sp.]|jgi:hypothetical protein|uniref:hypothetical protein n=1 Tax=Rhodophyticola sp. TaxID=2680032 RepID=UPI003D2A11AA
MSEFLAVLALYYACDATAATRPMSPQEMQACTATYDTVKTYFVTGFDLAPRGTLERFAQMTAAYAAFKDWEDSNSDLVAAMRADAMNRVRGLVPVDG